jgi:hypothetical protein
LLLKNLKIRIYKTIILPVVLYGCETWSLTLREEHRLQVFENRVLRRIFGPKRDEVTGEWRKLHTKSFMICTFRQGEGEEDGMGRACSTNWDKRNVYRLLVEKPEGRRPLERPRHSWLDNIRMVLVDMGSGDVDWIGLAQDRCRWRAVVNSVLNLRIL